MVVVILVAGINTRISNEPNLNIKSMIDSYLYNSNISSDFTTPNSYVAPKIVRIILRYTKYIRRAIWRGNV